MDNLQQQIQSAIEKATHPQLVQRYASDVLWHFVGGNRKDGDKSYETLISILKTGLRVGDCESEFIYRDGKKEQSVTTYGYKVSCLADIPLKDLLLHSSKYGQYAIGFHKRSAIRNHFNPVLYVNQYTNYFRHFQELNEDINSKLETIDKGLHEKYEIMMRYLGSMVKSGFLDLPILNDAVLDKTQIDNYYYEREWRSIYNWEFSKDDVAILIMPRTKFKKFIEDWKMNPNYRIEIGTPVLPFDMIWAL